MYDGTTMVSDALYEGITHTLSVWAEDSQGGKSAVVTRSFTIKINKPPVITVDTFTPVQSGLIPPDTITLSGTASDPDGDKVSVEYSLNSNGTKLIGTSNGNWSITIRVSDLKDGNNKLVIAARDQFGAVTAKNLTSIT
ncbi:Ig-like domain-containing protein [Brevibacillus borstelensis]|uniref:Ig-like domain-containing protein n=1 Tax=Brevibacillus borstelensis TaxID=45462 RepID=UPI0030BEDF3C